MKRIITCLLVLLLAGPGCAWFGPEEEKTAAELVAEGREEFADEKYRQAIDTYSKLKDWYPFSRFAKEAELKVADAHYQLKNYEQAIAAYEQYERLHPNDQEIPYVVYRTGRCYFDRMKGVDRDQTYTEKALRVFRQIRDRFPSSQYAEKAQKHILRCLKTLAGHELYVGEFYLKQGHYKAALGRFENVINDYPSDLAELQRKARSYINQCQEQLQRSDESSG